MKDAHAKFSQSAQECHFLGTNLACTQPRNRAFTEFILNGFEAQSKYLERRVPIYRFKVTIRFAQIRRGGAVRRTQWGECFPAFRASHSKVDRIIRCRAQIDRLPILEMNF